MKIEDLLDQIEEEEIFLDKGTEECPEEPEVKDFEAMSKIEKRGRLREQLKNHYEKLQSSSTDPSHIKFFSGVKSCTAFAEQTCKLRKDLRIMPWSKRGTPVVILEDEAVKLFDKKIQRGVAKARKKSRVLLVLVNNHILTLTPEYLKGVRHEDQKPEDDQEEITSI